MHKPDFIGYTNTYNLDLTLVWHSDCGQVAIPFITRLVLHTGVQKYVKDQYLIAKNRKLFVSKGIDTTKLQLRFTSTPKLYILLKNSFNCIKS